MGVCVYGCVCVWVCVCVDVGGGVVMDVRVCVCVRERERERERSTVVYMHLCYMTSVPTYHRFSPFVKTGSESFVLGRVSVRTQLTAADRVKIVVGPLYAHS